MPQAQGPEPSNPYEALQLHPDAPRELVDEVYWALVERVRQHAKVSSASERLLAELNRSYAILSDAERRRAYDESQGFVASTPWTRIGVATRRGLLGPRAPRYASKHSDDYHLLCVRREADSQVIDLAARILLSRYAGPQPERAFLRELVSNAYRMLSNPQRRAMYDASMGAGNGAPMHAEAAQRRTTEDRRVRSSVDNAHAQPASAPEAGAAPAAPGVQDVDTAIAEAAHATDASPPLPPMYARAGASSVPDLSPSEDKRDDVEAGQGSPPRPAADPGRGLLGRMRGAAAAAVIVARNEARIGVRHEDDDPSEDARQRLLTLHDTDHGIEIIPVDPPLHPDRGAAIASAELVFVAGPRTGARVSLGREAITIGSAYEADVMLPDETGDVAPHHARIWQHGVHFVFRQLAENGTLVAGRSLTLPLVMLDDGDDIQIGKHRMRFALHAPEAPFEQTSDGEAEGPA